MGQVLVPSEILVPTDIVSHWYGAGVVTVPEILVPTDIVTGSHWYGAGVVTVPEILVPTRHRLSLV